MKALVVLDLEFDEKGTTLDGWSKFYRALEKELNPKLGNSLPSKTVYEFELATQTETFCAFVSVVSNTQIPYTVHYIADGSFVYSSSVEN